MIIIKNILKADYSFNYYPKFSIDKFRMDLFSPQKKMLLHALLSKAETDNLVA